MSNPFQIGSINFDLTDKLGAGITSVVFRCKFGDRDIAVKRMSREHSILMEKEISLLQKSDSHPNIIRYFHTEKDENFFYIALELCQFTLKDYVERKDLQARVPLKEIIKQVFSGLTSLHTLMIVHRDIKPTNILLKENLQGQLTVKISDFGFAKQMNNSDSDMSIPVKGTRYWTIPEMEDNKYKIKSDVYSAGQLVNYLVVRGLENTNQASWESVKETFDVVSLKHLVMMMTRNNPNDRPPFECLFQHTYFWENQKILNFLVAVAGRLKYFNENDDPTMNFKKILEENSGFIIGNCWFDSLENAVKKSLGYRKEIAKVYDCKLISELLRGLRNMNAHYNELSQDAKDIFGSVPDGFSRYWLEKFPRLLIHVFVKVHKSELFKDENFGEFYMRKQFCDDIQS